MIYLKIFKESINDPPLDINKSNALPISNWGGTKSSPDLGVTINKEFIFQEKIWYGNKNQLYLKEPNQRRGFWSWLNPKSNPSRLVKMNVLGRIRDLIKNFRAQARLTPTLKVSYHIHFS